MTKIPAGILCVVLAFAALSSSSAEAGPSLYLKAPTSASILHKASDCDEDYEDDEMDEEETFSAYRKSSSRSVSARSKPAVKAVAPKVALAQKTFEPKPRLERVAARVEVESSSIATAREQVAATSGATCKNYFASAGMTLSVACE